MLKGFNQVAQIILLYLCIGKWRSLCDWPRKIRGIFSSRSASTSTALDSAFACSAAQAGHVYKNIFLCFDNACEFFLERIFNCAIEETPPEELLKGNCLFIEESLKALFIPACTRAHRSVKSDYFFPFGKQLLGEEDNCFTFYLNIFTESLVCCKISYFRLKSRKTNIKIINLFSKCKKNDFHSDLIVAFSFGARFF